MTDPNVLRSLLQGQGQGGPVNGAPQEPDPDTPEPQVGKGAKAEDAEQLDLSDTEIRRIGDKVDSDFNAAINDHQRRMNRNRRFYYLWRSRIGSGLGELGKSNYKVPLTEWMLLGMLAKQADAIFGDDAQIIAKPTTPTNADLTGKVGDYMTWRVFESMKAKLKILEFNFIKLMFGRAHAYTPYMVETFRDTPSSKEQISYQGPFFEPLMPDDFIVPAERVRTLHEFSWVIRRCYPTPDYLLEKEELDQYFGITDNFKNILIQSQNKRPRDNRTDQVREIKEHFEGVNYYFAWSWGEVVEVYEWYGNWRMLLDKNRDAEINDIERREKQRTELKVSYIPQLKQVIGVQLLADLYPGIKQRRPFVESAHLATGEYWGKGVPEMVEDAELEMSANENIETERAERAMSPMLGVRPRAGVKMTQARVEPGTIIELDDPERDVKVIQLVSSNQEYAGRQQALQGHAERVTGLTDSSLGRSPTTPNQPRTARQGLLMNENESVRLGLDYTVLREDWRIILERFWTLDCLYGPPETFFRVTGKTPQGLYDIDHGFGRMSAEERAGRFDFDIEFATSVYSKEAKKQYLSGLGTMALQTQLVATNPQAQWHILNDMYELAGVEFSTYIPKPPMPEQPMDPEDEWHHMLQGIPAHVHPLDQDNHHLIVHQVQFADALRDHTGARDDQAIKRLAIHIAEHKQQQDRKILAAQQTHLIMGIANMLGMNPGMMPGAQVPGMGGEGGQAGMGDGEQGQGGPPQMPMLGPGGPGAGQPSPPSPVGQPSPPQLTAPQAGGIVG